VLKLLTDLLVEGAWMRTDPEIVAAAAEACSLLRHTTSSAASRGRGGREALAPKR